MKARTSSTSRERRSGKLSRGLGECTRNHEVPSRRTGRPVANGKSMFIVAHLNCVNQQIAGAAPKIPVQFGDRQPVPPAPERASFAMSRLPAGGGRELPQRDKRLFREPFPPSARRLSAVSAAGPRLQTNEISHSARRACGCRHSRDRAPRPLFARDCPRPE